MMMRSKAQLCTPLEPTSAGLGLKVQCCVSCLKFLQQGMLVGCLHAPLVGGRMRFQNDYCE